MNLWSGHTLVHWMTMRCITVWISSLWLQHNFTIIKSQPPRAEYSVWTCRRERRRQRSKAIRECAGRVCRVRSNPWPYSFWYLPSSWTCIDASLHREDWNIRVGWVELTGIHEQPLFWIGRMALRFWAAYLPPTSKVQMWDTVTFI